MLNSIAALGESQGTLDDIASLKYPTGAPPISMDSCYANAHFGKWPARCYYV